MATQLIPITSPTAANGSSDPVALPQPGAWVVHVEVTGGGTADITVVGWVGAMLGDPTTDPGAPLAQWTGVGAGGYIVSGDGVPIDVIRVDWSSNTGTVRAALTWRDA